jgi:hypothetical protein
VANGAFAICACNMNGFPGELCVLQQGGNAFKSWLDFGH